MRIISHRGAGSLAPENSLRSIQIAKKLNIFAIEIDIRLTKDNVVVIFHDKSLLRLAGKNLLVSNIDFDALSKIKLKSGEFIPSLKDFLLSNNKPLLIEGKGTRWATYLKEELKKHKHLKYIRVISFNHSELAKFKSICPKIDCSSISIFRPYKTIDSAIKHKFEGVGIQILALNPFFYKKARKAGLTINTFISNSLFIARLYSFMYPEVEITTDRPDKLQKLNS
ncbi:MAG TPA: glycerophosphodiester phosphodiesterase family protein [Candidatus Saccharimonadia bacterium]|nr:glycerophosphodiester phosphodiesterase family protein [Candidatus Saccharimonadia bacterium]